MSLDSKLLEESDSLWASTQGRLETDCAVPARVAKRVLMIAYHYPPLRGSSGLHRTLGFARYLPARGWHPVLLTPSKLAYPDAGGGQAEGVPSTVVVKRTFAVDTARHLGFGGRYPGWLALPDRWVSWLLSAIPVGLRLIFKYKPKALWSSYPIATTHLIGLTLHRLTGIPWVADFRDPMTEVDPLTKEQTPSEPQLWKVRRWVERLTVSYCTHAVFVAPGALRLHAERYPEIPDSRWVLIPNGYDERAFAAAEQIAPPGVRNAVCLRLVHSGLLYPTPDRDPSAFFAALARLRESGQIAASNLQVILRATGHDKYYQQLIMEAEIGDIVSLEPPIPYPAALSEMLHADGLLIFQGRTSNPAIPAKLYEYLRARRPILAMVAAEGDTAQALRSAKVGKIAPLTSEDEIATGLLEFIEEIRQSQAPLPEYEEIRKHSREYHAEELALLLDKVVG